MNKSQIALYSFLAFVVASSKNIIIYNEEIIILINFIAFLYFMYSTTSVSVVESLQERSDAIKHEFQRFLDLKKELLLTLISAHKKQKEFDLSLLAMAGTNEIKFISQAAENVAQSRVYSKVMSKLKRLVQTKQSFTDSMQSSISNSFEASVLENFQNARLQAQLKNQAIEAIKETAKAAPSKKKAK
jgi:hypothetical protein